VRTNPHELMKSFIYPARYSLQPIPEDEQVQQECPTTVTSKTISLSMTAAGILLFIAGAGAVFAQINLPAPVDAQTAKQQAFAVFPIFGAVLVSAGICLLHNVREGKSVIAGRVIFALLAGVVGPWITEAWYPAIINKVSDIRLQLLLGMLFGGSGYIFSRTFVEKFFKIAPSVADGTVNHLARRYTPVPQPTEKLDP
jgi:hypothetical protein